MEPPVNELHLPCSALLWEAPSPSPSSQITGLEAEFVWVDALFQVVFITQMTENPMKAGTVSVLSAWYQGMLTKHLWCEELFSEKS